MMSIDRGDVGGRVLLRIAGHVNADAALCACLPLMRIDFKSMPQTFAFVGWEWRMMSSAILTLSWCKASAEIEYVASVEIEYVTSVEIESFFWSSVSDLLFGTTCKSF